jgi:hypothetical protein
MIRRHAARIGLDRGKIELGLLGMCLDIQRDQGRGRYPDKSSIVLGEPEKKKSGRKSHSGF